MTTTLARADSAAEGVTSYSTPRPEYPRPQFDRSHSWRSLNGTWQFRRGGSEGSVEAITVPFAWETPASGVEAPWLERAEYRRSFTLPPAWSGSRIVLHFGAVHHEAVVRVDGTTVGSHRGGYVPFEFDITESLALVDEHELVVEVHAPNDKRFIAHGKQRSAPQDDYDSCAFTPTSGIWQPVWLEARPATYLADLVLRPTPELDGIIVSGRIQGAAAEAARIRIAVSDEPSRAQSPLVEAETDADLLAAGLTLLLPSVQLWSPATPHLYRVSVTVDSADGTDVVESVTGVRNIATRNGCIYLNDEQISFRGVLDQGYWPETGATAPDDEAFVRDIELAREAGFNMVRKHLKLEDPRFHHHADRMGMLVWAEPASTGRFSPVSAQAFEDQIEPMVRRDGNHPSIVVWGLYNEEWGLDWALPEDPAKQDAVRAARSALLTLDSTRPVVDNSGWTHLTTDLMDWHVYDEHPAGWARKVADLVADDNPTFPVAIAVDTLVQKRLMIEGPVPRDIPFINSEFGGGWTSLDRGWNLHWQTQELRRYDSIAGWVWTELNDVEHESAGIVYADRSMKDHGGRPPRHANAETATVFDLVPEAPGRDLVTTDGRVSVDVHVSHHGTAPMSIDVLVAWGSVFSTEPFGGTEYAGSVDVEPFRLSSAVTIRSVLASGVRSGRLHVFLVHDGTVEGRGAVDVVQA